MIAGNHAFYIIQNLKNSLTRGRTHRLQWGDGLYVIGLASWITLGLYLGSLEKEKEACLLSFPIVSRMQPSQETWLVFFQLWIQSLGTNRLPLPNSSAHFSSSPLEACACDSSSLANTTPMDISDCIAGQTENIISGAMRMERECIQSLFFSQ